MPFQDPTQVPPQDTAPTPPAVILDTAEVATRDSAHREECTLLDSLDNIRYISNQRGGRVTLIDRRGNHHDRGSSR